MIKKHTTKEEYLSLLLGEEIHNLKSIKCGRPGCGSTDIKTWEFQTRSSDEPVTIFHKCKVCGYVEVDSGG